MRASFSTATGYSVSLRRLFACAQQAIALTIPKPKFLAACLEWPPALRRAARALSGMRPLGLSNRALPLPPIARTAIDRPS